MKVLTEWASIDDDNRLIFDIPKLLEAMGVRDTPENRTRATEEAAKTVREWFPDLPQHKTAQMGWCDACGWDDAVEHDRLVRRGYTVLKVPTKKHNF